MEQINDLVKARLEKRAKLLEQGTDPYGSRFDVPETIAVVRTNPAPERDVQIAGRLMSHRDMGKSLFADVKDSTGRIQIYMQKKVLTDEKFDRFKHLIDLGDIVGITGKLFTTHAGELTVRVEDFTTNICQMIGIKKLFSEKIYLIESKSNFKNILVSKLSNNLHTLDKFGCKMFINMVQNKFNRFV